LLTGDNSHALASMSFWAAMPIAVFCSICVGVLFGLPVLGVRGDYLAVATLGLGEIVRAIVVSDFAAPLLGGAQGLLQVPRPVLFGYVLSGPVQLFYLTLIAALIAAWFAWRLENSRLGRAWMALRDDEDVAQALGINLVRVKLLAYGLGAAFAGLAGSIFDETTENVRDNRFHPDGAGDLRYHDHIDRASDARGDDHVGPDLGAGPWGEDCRGHAGRGAERPKGDRGVPGQPQGNADAGAPPCCRTSCGRLTHGDAGSGQHPRLL
jgi:hypothetical protein